MRKLIKRTKKDEGASLSIALLLFLVCAMAASIVVAASSAAGGRMSNIKNMDKRYYAVTSAAELLRDMVSGTVTFRQSCTTKSQDGDIYYRRVSTETHYNDMIGYASEVIAFGNDESKWDSMEAWNLEYLPISKDITLPTFTMKPSKSDVEEVTVDGVLKKEGYLVLYIKNKASSDTEQYTLKMTCVPDLPIAGALSSHTTVSGDVYTTVESKDVRVTWERSNCVIER